jgi:hypothetical protein
MELQTYKVEILEAVAYAIRELGKGVLDDKKARVERMLMSFTQRIAKAEYKKAANYLHGAREHAISIDPVISLHIERAELLLDRWMNQRPEKNELPSSVDSRTVLSPASVLAVKISLSDKNIS